MQGASVLAYLSEIIPVWSMTRVQFFEGEI